MRKLSAGMLQFAGAPQEYVKLARAQNWGSERVFAEQIRKLGRILSWCKSELPYYSVTLPAFDRVNSAPLAALKSAPLLTKAVIRQEGIRLTVNRRRIGIKRITSGGSTGEPAVFCQDAAYRKWNRASKLLFDSWTGVSIGHRKAVLWAAPNDVDGARSWKGRLREQLWNRYMLDAYRMSESDMWGYLDRLESDTPDQLQVYAESGYELARFALAEGLKVKGIEAILSSAGTLYPDMRSTIEEAFGASVFNRYGSREVGDIACECNAHQGLHVNPLTHYVEILRNDDTPAAPGELGRVIVTSLTNFVQPLIRYEIGDMARWAEGDCPCGCQWPLLSEISGRVTDHLKSAEGDVMYGGILRQLLYEVLYIKKYQWVQYALDQITLRVVFEPNEPPSNSDWQRDVNWLEQEVEEMLGSGVDFTVQVVDGINPSPSGKHLYVVSHV